MSTRIANMEPAIRRGIKTVGVGKKGSKDLDPALIQEILTDLREGKISPIAKGAFFAGLVMKGVTPEEMILDQAFESKTLNNPAQLVKALADDAPVFVQEICLRILEKKELDKATARRLGNFLFSENPGDGARGLVASALRVRYETADEYEGLLSSMQATLEKPFRQPVPSGEPVLQIAEPFDGVDHSYLITPLLARFVQAKGYRVVNMVGRNSGPKLVNNVWDLARESGGTFLHGNKELTEAKPDLGWFVDQKDLSSAVDRWVELRREIIKRPFLSTLEKFLNPAVARIVISSAFHPPYGEKMATAAERAGFPGSIVVRNGMEGTIAFPLKRAVKILCSARQSDGSYVRNEMIFDTVAFLGFEVPVEEKWENPSLKENADLVLQYVENGKTGNELFDYRVKATCAGIQQAVEWVEKYLRID